MQVLMSFTLNLKHEMTEEELRAYLEDNCPLELGKDAPFEISTERWEITYS